MTQTECRKELYQLFALSLVIANRQRFQTWIPHFFDHHSFLCSSLFSKILDDKEHKLHHMLPPIKTYPRVKLRQSRVFDLSYKTNRTKNRFINFQCNLFNNNKNTRLCILQSTFSKFFFSPLVSTVIVHNLANGYHLYAEKVSKLSVL